MGDAAFQGAGAEVQAKPGWRGQSPRKLTTEEQRQEVLFKAYARMIQA